MSAPLLNLQERFEFLSDLSHEDRTALGERGVDGDLHSPLHVSGKPDVWLLDALCDALDAVGPAVNAYIAAEGRL